MPDIPPFHTPAQLVRWWLHDGRLAMGGVRGVDYDREGRPRASRDFSSLERLHAKFAAVVQATAELTEAQTSLLVLAYQEGRTDLQIGERLGLSRAAITRRRHQALNVVAVAARRLGLLPEADAPVVYPQSSREGWRRDRTGGEPCAD